MDNLCSDLEIDVSADSPTTYAVEMRFRPAGREDDSRLLRDARTISPAIADLSAIGALDPASDEYSAALLQALFKDPLALDFFKSALNTIDTLDAPIRIRLLLDSTVPALHELRWERLTDAQGRPLCTNEQIRFSRYLPDSSLRPPRPVGQVIKALIAISSPDMKDWDAPGGHPLAPIDIEAELAHAVAALPNASRDVIRNPTLQTLTAKLREGFDVLYLVCHGTIVDDQPKLMLCDPKGGVGLVSGQQIVSRLHDIPSPPRLVVLASCRSAQGIHSLGPMLAQANIPAVLAMNGDLSMKTNALFMPEFFRQLSINGLIDKAVSVARGTIRDEHDHWMPVLYMRLSNGLLWHQAESAAPEPPLRTAAPPPPVPQHTSHLVRNVALALVVATLGLLSWAYFTAPDHRLYYSFSVHKVANDKLVGATAEIAKERIFEEDEVAALNIQTTEAGRLFVFASFEDGKVEVLYPDGGSSSVAANLSIRIPRERDQFIGMDNGTITIVMSDDALPELQNIVASAVRDKAGALLVPKDRQGHLEKRLQDTLIYGSLDPKADPSMHTTILGSATPFAYRITTASK